MRASGATRSVEVPLGSGQPLGDRLLADAQSLPDLGLTEALGGEVHGLPAMAAAPGHDSGEQVEHRFRVGAGSGPVPADRQAGGAVLGPGDRGAGVSEGGAVTGSGAHRQRFADRTHSDADALPAGPDEVQAESDDVAGSVEQALDLVARRALEGADDRRAA